MGRLGVLTATTGAVAGVVWAVVLASGFTHEFESEPLEEDATSFLAVSRSGELQPVLPQEVEGEHV
eukprot:g13068.t1